MSMQRQLPDKAGHADPWTLCCAECAQIMRIATATPAREGTETRTYECACGYREILDVPLHWREVTIRRSKLALGPLASGDLPPHMASMTSTENRQTHASDHAAAIARWDDEDGAPSPAPRKNDAGVSKEPRRSGRNRTGINSGAELSKS